VRKRLIPFLSHYLKFMACLFLGHHVRRCSLKIDTDHVSLQNIEHQDISFPKNIIGTGSRIFFPLTFLLVDYNFCYTSTGTYMSYINL